MSLSCIAQNIIEAIVPLYLTFLGSCHLDKNGCKLEKKHLLK